MGHRPVCHILNALGKSGQGAETPGVWEVVYFILFLRRSLTLVIPLPPSHVLGSQVSTITCSFTGTVFVASYSPSLLSR